MRILVSGATGFIGSHLAPRLRQQGHEVWAGVRYVSGGRFNFYDQAQRVFFDLNDSLAVHEAVRKVAPDVVIHLAAQSAVSYSFDHPEEVARVDYLGTVYMTEAALEAGAHLVQASTSEVYGRASAKPPFKEDDSLGATSPYAAAKIAAEEYIRTRGATSGLRYTIVRPFNTIGRAPLRNPHFVVERAITQAIQNGKISLHDPTPLRDFVFRDDHVEGYAAVVGSLKEAQGQAFNLCTGDAWSIRRMAEYVAGVVQARLKTSFIDVSFAQAPDRPLDIPVLQGDGAKIKRLLNWEPRYTIADGIHKGVEEWIAALKGS